MQLQNSETDAMRNYVIVEANCRGCGKSRLKLSMEDWARLKSCPQCHHSCVCQYLGHGFTSESAVDWTARREGAAVHEQPVC